MTHNDTKLNNILFDKDTDEGLCIIDFYDIYIKGYLEMAKDVLTPAEIESLPWGARLMTLECGMRFLADFLQGRCLFKESISRAQPRPSKDTVQTGERDGRAV